MPIFSYRAATKDGGVVEGAIEAADEKTAVERLRNTGVIPIKLAAPKEGGLRKRLATRSARGDVLIFTTELSALLSAGLPLDRCLNIISEISESGEMKEIVQSILRSIREGSSFSDALQKHPKIFSRLYINMIRAGEAGGVLDVVLDKLTEFMESSKELRDHIVSSMIYPAILTIAGGISIVILLTFVLPRFSSLFSELGAAIPLPTKIVLGLSSAIRSYWWLFAAVLGGGAFLFYNFIRTEAGKYKWDSFKLKMMKDIITKIETERFCRTLGMLLRSGVPLLQALSNARDVINNRAIYSALEDLHKGAKEGKGLAVPLVQAGVFPPLAISMVKVGEETGQLDAMLLKVASTYEKSLRVSIKRFISFLEPALIIGMALIIGFIVVAVLMAVFGVLELPG